MQLSAKGFHVSFSPMDIREESQIRRMTEKTLQQYGGVDILVNNAGVLCEDALLEDVSEETWNRLIAINLTGMYRVCKAVLPQIRARGGGSVVNIASTSALMASYMDPPYCASKAGVLGLTRSTAYDYAQFSIRCNAVCPGTTETEMIDQYLTGMSPEEIHEAKTRWARLVPLGRLVRPQEVAAAVLFLASPASSFITGVALPVDGGRCIL